MLAARTAWVGHVVKWLLPPPTNSMEATFKATLPLFVTISTRLDVVPTSTVPKSSSSGKTAMVGIPKVRTSWVAEFALVQY